MTPATRQLLRRWTKRAGPGLLAALLAVSGCGGPQALNTEVTPWIWIANPNGVVGTKASSGSLDVLDFKNDLNFDEIAFPFGIDLGIEFERKMITLSVWDVGFKGSATFSSPKEFGGTTFAAGEVVSSSFNLPFYRIGYANTFGLPGERSLALEGALQVIDFDVTLRSPTQSGRFSGTVPVLVVGVRGEYRLTDRLGLRGRAIGLSYSRVLGVQSDFFGIRGEFLDYRLELTWDLGQTSTAQFGWASFVMDLENGSGDRLKTRLVGPVASLQIRF